MAGIAQLVERQIVALNVTGSSPVIRPHHTLIILYKLWELFYFPKAT